MGQIQPGARIGSLFAHSVAQGCIPRAVNVLPGGIRFAEIWFVDAQRGHAGRAGRVRLRETTSFGW